MSTLSIPTESPTEYHHRLAEECPIAVTTWRRAKGLIYSAIVLGVIVLSAYVEARWQLYLAGIVAVVIFYVGEVHEIDIMNFATITFLNTEERDDD